MAEMLGMAGTPGKAGTPGMVGTAGKVGTSARNRGFTLVEMLVALGILVFGLTSLIGLMSAGVSTRMGAELRDRAVLAADKVFHDLETKRFATRSMPEGGEELPRFESIGPEPIEGFPRLKARIDFKYDDLIPDLVLVEIHVTWLTEGLTVGEVFSRVMDPRVPFPTRVAKKTRSKP